MKDILDKLGYSEENRAAYYLLVDDTVRRGGAVEVHDVKEAKRYGFEVPEGTQGVFLRVKENEHLKLPIQACFVMLSKKRMRTYNIVLLEQNAKATLISGCAAGVLCGTHVGTTKIILKEGAMLNIVRIHAWRKDTEVFVADEAKLHKNSSLSLTQVTLTPVKSERLISVVDVGENAVFRKTTVLLAEKGTFFDVKGVTTLSGQAARAFVSSKVAVRGGYVLTNERIVGSASESRGHIECHGILLGSDSQFSTIPELVAKNPHVMLTHEAGIGRISPEELFYLQTKGFSEEEAKNLLVTGFLTTTLENIPENVRKSIENLLNVVLSSDKSL